MSDVIVVMRDGRIQQQGDPTELYERPVNRFVADFIGTSNFMTATVVASDGSRITVRSSQGLTLRGGVTDPDARLAAGATVTVATRPERLEIAPATESPSGGMGLTEIQGRVTQGTYLGQTVSRAAWTRRASCRPPLNAAGARAPGVGPGDQ
jgi:ABC-type Fe3+/spermidine/putrescine transport system ATPase subunit